MTAASRVYADERAAVKAHLEELRDKCARMVTQGVLPQQDHLERPRLVGGGNQ